MGAAILKCCWAAAGRPVLAAVAQPRSPSVAEVLRHPMGLHPSCSMETFWSGWSRWLLG